MSKQEKIIIFTDGGARGNPGPAAIGVVIKDASGHTIKSYGEAIGETTNNEAEYRAVISALAKVKALLGKEKVKNIALEINMDSELVKKQLNGEYRIEEEKLFPFFIKIWNLRMDFGEVKFHHIPRERNKEADRLVNEALDKEQQNLF
ncbi:MAG: ribonuclease HI family protein [Candidatus Sungbacteria bacterium]|nr:ribonuclease HI family protein [Candidatus Sungbacteria bacterium]